MYFHYFNIQVICVPQMAHPHVIPTPESSLLAVGDHTYTRNVVHPLTQTTSRFVLGDRFHDSENHSGHKKPTCKFHQMKLCPELVQYQSVTSEVINSKIKSVKLQSSSQQNLTHYYFYNRLMDHWHNVDIINNQKSKLMQAAQHGETIVRDCLHRFKFVCSTCHQPGHTSQYCQQ